MTTYNALREIPAAAGYGHGDVLVLFGELFGRGYANGIVDEAKRAGMTVIGATVGRRDSEGALRPLNEAELAEAEANLGGKIINVPMEAGFDMEPGGDGPSPVEQLKAAKPDAWQTFTLDWDAIAKSEAAGVARFQRNLEKFVAELQPLIPAAANVLFVHTMAGGIPRARVYMPLLNRVFKGTGDKNLPSDLFWQCDLGKLCAVSFDEVTAKTFERLIDATASFRTGERRVRYVAYGYHGCEVMIGGEYVWQTYVPYLQGWAKMLLEELSEAAWTDGVRCTVFNSPEIQTNSSALFLGVEISLYPLLSALLREGGDSAAVKGIADACTAMLKEGESLEGMLAKTEEFLSSPVMAPFRKLEEWPQHNTRAQMEAMLAASADIMGMSADTKNPVCAELSRHVFTAVGQLMFDESWEPTAPVLWLNHDVIAKRLTTR